MNRSIQDVAMAFCSSRSEKDFSSLYNRLLPGLRTYARHIVTDLDLVDETVAIALAKAYSLVDSYDSTKGAFSTWVYRICRNECLCELRRKAKEPSLDNLIEAGSKIRAVNREDIEVSSDYDYITSESNEPTHDDYLKAVMEELENLPAKMREPYEDFTFRQMKYEDIAISRGIPSNTVRSRIFNARNTLRKSVLKKFESDEREKGV